MYRRLLEHHLDFLRRNKGQFHWPLASFDIETDTLGGRITLAGAGLPSGEITGPSPPDVLSQVSTPYVVMHNGKYDLRRMVESGHEPPPKVYIDSMAAYWLLNEEEKRLGLKYVVPKALGVRDEQWQKGWEANQGDNLETYLRGDLRYTRQLMLHLWPQLAEQGLLNLFLKVESPMSYLAAQMEQQGIRLDRGKLEAEWNGSKRRVEKLKYLLRRTCPDAPWGCERCEGSGTYHWKRPAGKTSDCRDCGGTGEGKFITSPDQLGEFLFGTLGLVPLVFTENDNPSTAGDSLLRLAASSDHRTARFLRLVHAFREEGQLFKTFWNPYMERGSDRIHPEWKPWGTKTARFSCKDPNMMNLPPRVRQVIIPDEGYVFADGDYVQLEVYLMGVLANETKILEAYENGIDLHERTGQAVGGDRSVGKVYNFAIPYGLSDLSIADRLGIDKVQAGEIRKTVLGDYDSLRTWLSETKREGARKGYVQTLLGRRRRLPGLLSSNPRDRAHAENQAVNSPVQGSAADLMKCAQIQCYLKVREAIPVLQIHDELVNMIPEENYKETAANLKECMEQALPNHCQPKVDMRVTRRWKK